MGFPHNTDRVLRNLRWRQRFPVFKRARSPDAHGRGTVTTEQKIYVLGVIQPSGGEDLDRLDEGDRAMGAVTVWSNTPLSTGTDDELPDEIEWKDCRYLVRHVTDWSDYGLGWCKAICVAQSMKERAS